MTWSVAALDASGAFGVAVARRFFAVAELRRLHDRSLERFQPFVACLPRIGDPAGITDRAVIEAEIARFQATRGRGNASG